MASLNGKPLTQDYFDFCMKKARFNGKVDFIKKVTNLTKAGMTLEQAFLYLGEEIKDELSNLTYLEKYYEG